MAHHSATKKSIRQTVKVTERNRSGRSKIRTAVKKVERAITEKATDTAVAALKEAQKTLFKGVSKGLIKKNAASRKLSRLNAHVKGLKG